MYATIFGQFTAASQFFELHRGNRSAHARLSEKIQYLRLDLFIEVSHCGAYEGNHNEQEFKR